MWTIVDLLGPQRQRRYADEFRARFTVYLVWFAVLAVVGVIAAWGDEHAKELVQALLSGR